MFWNEKNMYNAKRSKHKVYILLKNVLTSFQSYYPENTITIFNLLAARVVDISTTQEEQNI